MRVNHKAIAGGLLLAGVGSALLFHARATADEPFAFVSFDYPGAVSTVIYGINNRGDMVGSYDNPQGFFHGFVYRGGQFTSIDGPGAAYTEMRGINDVGDVVGTFIPFSSIIAETPGGGFQGLLQRNGGSLTVLNVPNHLNTIFNKITPRGSIYGCFHDEGFDNTPQETMHGIYIPADGLKDFSLKSIPGGGTMNGGGNFEGTRFAGQSYDFTVNRHRSYIIENGQRLDFDVPGSNLTITWDMNASGDVVGVWGDQEGHPDPEATSAGNYHGFLRDAQGVYTDIRFPGSLDTKAFGLNNETYIVGSYVDAGGKGHGFIARKGEIRSAVKDGRAPAGRPAIVKASFGGQSSGTEAVRSVRVARMRVIPNGTPLQAPASMPACHQIHEK